MLVSIEKKIAFLAMTKTASTSIEAALSPYCDIAFYNNPRVKHIPWRRYNRFVTPYLNRMGFSDIETTCLFREPVSWLFSWYRYRARPEVLGKGQSTDGITFDYFVKAYIEGGPESPRIGRPSHFVCNPKGEVSIDHLFRFENMNGFQSFIENRFDKKFTFERVNTSPQKEFSLSAKLQSSIEGFLAPEYEIYENARKT